MAKERIEIPEDLELPKDWVPLYSWFQVFYKQQNEFLASTAWQSWFVAGNGTGKTHIIFWSIAAYALGIHPKQIAKPPLRICCLVPDFDKVMDVALEKLLSPQRLEPQGIDLGPMLPDSMIKKGFSKDHRSIDLKNGSTIPFVTNEQGWGAMRGKQFDIFAMDEECDERVFDENIRGLRNAKGGGKVIAGLTPPYEEGCGPTWTKEKVVDASLTDKDIEVFNACMADNPAISSEFITRFSKGKTKVQVQVQVYGQYPTWGDLVHPDFQDTMWRPDEIRGHLLSNDTELPDSHKVDWVMAFDWHPSKPCAAVFGYISTDGNLIIFDELDAEVARGKDIDELSEIFKNIEGHPFSERNFRRWQDPSAKSKYQAVQRGFNAWDAFRQVGIITSAGKNRDPGVGISIVNDYFKGNAKDHPRIFIYERCKYLRRYLNNHYWKRDEGGKGKPDPKWSDYPICVRYVLEACGWKHKKKKRQNKWPLQSFKAMKPEKTIIDVSHIA
ncbi:hypothetical protein KAR91_23270 [Candidatus Pacearchaeota archaeon]|nr:hypothetical protein [Candidatus Pacearchaeota archaeon]